MEDHIQALLFPNDLLYIPSCDGLNVYIIYFFTD